MIPTKIDQSHCEEILEMLGAYALDALEADERERVETHIQYCSDCQMEALSALNVVGELGYLAPSIEPSDELKTRLWASAGLAPSSAQVEPNVEAQEPVSITSRRRWIAAALGVAAALLIAGLGVMAVMLDRAMDDRDEALGSAQMIASYVSEGGEVVPLTAQDATIYESYKGKGSLLTAPGKDPMVIVSGCPKSNDYLTYRVWYAKEGERSPAGTLWVNDNGTGWLRLSPDVPLTAFDTIGVTAVMQDDRREDVLVGPIPEQVSG